MTARARKPGTARKTKRKDEAGEAGRRPESEKRKKAAKPAGGRKADKAKKAKKAKKRTPSRKAGSPSKARKARAAKKTGPARKAKPAKKAKPTKKGKPAKKAKKARKSKKGKAPTEFAPENQDFLGLVGNELQIAVARNANLAYLAQQYRRAGVGHVRIALNWASIEPEPGRLDWGYEDLRVDMIANAGMRTLGILGVTPQWASSCPDLIGADGQPLFSVCIAADLDDYRDYVRRTVQRYGPAGSGQIRDWEIRIESNPPPGQTAYGVEQYVLEANAAFEVIREEDREARVWVGEYAFGRNNRDQGLKWTIFVAENGKFDVHTIHHFNTPEQVLSLTEEVRQELDERSLGDKPIAVSAMNVFVADPGSYTEQMQAENLRKLYVNAWKAGARYAQWFSGTQWPDLADRKFGIFRYDFTVPDRVVPRLAYDTLRDLGGLLPSPPPPAAPYGCIGVSSNPAVAVDGEARVALHYSSTGIALPFVQVRDGDGVVACTPSNRPEVLEITVPQGTSRTLVLVPTTSCDPGPVLTGPLARVTVEALP